MPYCVSALGCSSTRTAGSDPPPTVTSPTPVTCATFCASTVEAMSYISAVGLGLRGQRQDHDRRLRRVDLAVVRHARQRAGQQRPAGVDGGLHLARRGVDVLAQVELEHDPARSLRAPRPDLVDAGDRAQRTLERRRDAAGHRLGAGAGQVGADRDDGEVHLRQRRHRQLQERDGAGQHDRQVQQRRGDRAGDERGRQAHGTLTPWRRSPTICDWLAPRQRRARRSKNR